ncbi:MAG: hypothetical protein HGJ93_10375 [Desulfosarcina sp.]|nr:hypothetical protein [Desulfosarcina sp.]MBC2766338.1 hypothetical protein [Desulfosarcina sp.]
MNYSNTVNRYFQPALVKAKLPPMRWHDLRHTFASLLIHPGENIVTVHGFRGSTHKGFDSESNPEFVRFLRQEKRSI